MNNNVRSSEGATPQLALRYYTYTTKYNKTALIHIKAVFVFQTKRHKLF